MLATVGDDLEIRRKKKGGSYTLRPCLVSESKSLQGPGKPPANEQGGRGLLNKQSLKKKNSEGKN